MAAEVRFSAQATTELERAVAWYESQKPGLGLAFLKASEDAIAKIAENPFRFSTSRPPLRQFLLKKFPFTIIYEAGDCIWIAAIWHQKRLR